MKVKSASSLFSVVVLLLLFLFSNLPDVEGQRRGKRGRRGVARGHQLEFLDHLHYFVNDNLLPKYLKIIYKRDAARLALRLVQQEQRVSEQAVRIPDELVQLFYNTLVAVRLSDYEAIDTIATHYNIRTFPIPNLESLVLVVPHQEAWLQPLIQGADTTGNEVVNTLIKDYNLKMTRLVYIDEQHAGLVLVSREPLNMAALQLAFYNQADVISTREVLPYPDGNDIQATPTKDGCRVIYRLRFGSCGTGCVKSFEWTFEVDASGEVHYLGYQGRAIPPWIKPRYIKEPDVLKKH